MTIDFGTDLYCLEDIDASGRVVSGIEGLAQAIYRRFITPRGWLLDDPDYGTALIEFLGDSIDASGLGRIRAAIVGEAMKDERVASVDATVRIDGAGIITCTLQILSALGPFKMVLGVSGVSVDLLEVTPS